jgi:hypothetical protein
MIGCGSYRHPRVISFAVKNFKGERKRERTYVNKLS